MLALNESLHRLHIALWSVDSSYGLDTRDAVVAFQKLGWLPDGMFDSSFFLRGFAIHG